MKKVDKVNANPQDLGFVHYAKHCLRYRACLGFLKTPPVDRDIHNSEIVEKKIRSENL